MPRGSRIVEPAVRGSKADGGILWNWDRRRLELLQSEQLHAERSGIAWDLAVQHGFILSALAHLGRLRELSRNVLKLIADAKRA
jgi:hypothetical protein